VCCSRVPRLSQIPAAHIKPAAVLASVVGS
jgi:hypothetical protein